MYTSRTPPTTRPRIAPIEPLLYEKLKPSAAQPLLYQISQTVPATRPKELHFGSLRQGYLLPPLTRRSFGPAGRIAFSTAFAVSFCAISM
jgi:hypothetical protein